MVVHELEDVDIEQTYSISKLYIRKRLRIEYLIKLQYNLLTNTWWKLM